MTYFCFGCENTGVYEEKGETIKLAPKEFQSSTESINEIKTFDIRGFRERKIKKEIAELYDVKVGYSEEDGNTIKYHYYPITNKGKIVGYERRDLDTKKFLAIGSVKNKDEFFGQSKFAPGSCKRIVVTEGAGVVTVGVVGIICDGLSMGLVVHLNLASENVFNHFTWEITD